MTRPHYEISKDHKRSECSSCGAEIYWVTTAKGANMPCDPDGFSHFDTCPDAAKHSGKGKKKATTKRKPTELEDAYLVLAELCDEHEKKLATYEERHQKLRKWAGRVEQRLQELEGVRNNG